MDENKTQTLNNDNNDSSNFMEGIDVNEFRKGYKLYNFRRPDKFSKDTLRALQDELNEASQIIEFKEDNKWASQAYTLTPMVKSRNNWRNLFETALDDLTGLVSPKRIVYCEGRAEPTRTGGERGFDAAVFNSIFGEKYPDTLDTIFYYSIYYTNHQRLLSKS